MDRRDFVKHTGVLLAAASPVASLTACSEAPVARDPRIITPCGRLASTPHGLEGEFRPAKADCRRQGTAGSPPSAANPRSYGAGRGSSTPNAETIRPEGWFTAKILGSRLRPVAT